ncbi:hypothetical protein RW64_17105 [Geobacter sulfurreducens]|nr:hypothetical protein RW64_17105 [Geobacter sulfurreducens]
MDLEQKLKCIRVLRGITQQEAADALSKARPGNPFKVHTSVINRHESGKMQPRERVLHAYAKLYDVDVNWLLGRSAPFIASVFRPICPYELVPSVKLATFCKELEDILPTFYDGMGFTECVRLEADVIPYDPVNYLGGVYIMSKKDCYAILIANSFNYVAEKALGKRLIGSVPISPEFFVEFAISPALRIKEILNAAGITPPCSPESIVPARYKEPPMSHPAKTKVCFELIHPEGDDWNFTARQKAILERLGGAFPEVTEAVITEEQAQKWDKHLAPEIKEAKKKLGWLFNDDFSIKRRGY